MYQVEIWDIKERVMFSNNSGEMGDFWKSGIYLDIL